jgi:hypothetical protein
VKIYTHPAACSLNLLGAKVVFGADNAIDLRADVDGQDRVWVVSRKRVSSQQALGRFYLHDNTLSFNWEDAIPESAQPDLLRYCLLEISAGDRAKKVCRLSRPTVVPGLRLASIRSSSTVSLRNLDVTNFSKNTLLLEIKARDVLASVKASPDAAITLGQQQEFLINGGAPDAEGPRIGLLVHFATEENNQSKGVIRVLSKIAFKESKDKDEHALLTSRESLQLDKLAATAKEARENVKGFETQLKLAQSETLANRRRASSELKAFDVRIQDCKRNVSDAKESRSLQYWQAQLQMAILRKETYENSIDSDERELKARIEVEETAALRAEALLKLANGVCEKGLLEYRIFSKIGDKDVEFYRTAGFDK